LTITHPSSGGISVLMFATFPEQGPQVVWEQD
jgi:hypothetical protein